MITEFRQKQKLDKIDELVKLIGCYETVVIDIVSKVYDHEKTCAIYAFEANRSRKSSSFTPVNEFHIINLLIQEDKKNMIWDLFHEHGHQQDIFLRKDHEKLYNNDDSPTKRCLERELYAWRKADKEFYSHPELKIESGNFTTFKIEKLATYGLTIKKLNIFHDAANHLQIANPEYETVFYRLVNMAHEKECSVDYGREGYEYLSSHEQNYKDGSNYRIHIKKYSYQNNKEFIWDLLHELGHRFDTPLTISQEELNTNIKLRNEREMNAWKAADILFKKQYELRNDLEEYTVYKEKCLKSYELTLEDLDKHKISKNNSISIEDFEI